MGEAYPLRGDGKPICLRCCWGDRCDDPSHYYRPDCPYCKGTGIATNDDVRAYLLAKGNPMTPNRYGGGLLMTTTNQEGG